MTARRAAKARSEPTTSPAAAGRPVLATAESTGPMQLDTPRTQACVLDLEAAGYVPHVLHGADATWLEKNCYVDLWIELIGALGLEPLAIWPCTAAIDFEGDQWTFFKPPLTELRALYGIDVQELNVWRPLPDHLIEHLAGGRLVSVEVDAFWLPDTAGTDYHRKHTKTTIVVNDLDLDARRIGYFHNAGYFEATGDDCAHLVGLPEQRSDLEAIADWRGGGMALSAHIPQVLEAAALPLYAEFVRTDRLARRSTQELRALALDHLRNHLAFRPATNPVRRFGERFARDLPTLRARGLDHYHLWAFGTVRQFGAAYEFAARGLAWQAPGPESAFHAAAAAFDSIARDAKSLILKGARAVTSSKPVDLAPLVDGMASVWDEAMTALDRACA